MTAPHTKPENEQDMKPMTLAERIKALRTEAEAWLDDKAAQLAKDTPGVPVGVLRNLIAARAPGCACLQVLRQEDRP